MRKIASLSLTLEGGTADYRHLRTTSYDKYVVLKGDENRVEKSSDEILLLEE